MSLPLTTRWAMDYASSSTHLAADPLQGDLLAEIDLISNRWTPLGKAVADAFREACRKVADLNDGWVNPNVVREFFLDDNGDWLVSPRTYAAQWAPASGPHGFLDVMRDVPVTIQGEGSRGNGNKTVPMRRWRNDPSP